MEIHLKQCTTFAVDTVSTQLIDNILPDYTLLIPFTHTKQHSLTVALK